MNAQAKDSIEKNISYFDKNQNYEDYVRTLDTYKYCTLTINQTIGAGVGEVLDIGNGGIINYNVSKIEHVVALDLFLDENSSSGYPNVIYKKGSALAIPFPDNCFDMILMQNLLHHVVGKDINESKQLLEKVTKEAHRVLKPNGKLLILESTVPRWFFYIEKKIYAMFWRLNPINHPPVLQYTQEYIKMIAEANKFSLIEFMIVPKGKYIIQFGIKFPSILTPARMVKLLFKK